MPGTKGRTTREKKLSCSLSTGCGTIVQQEESEIQKQTVEASGE